MPTPASLTWADLEPRFAALEHASLTPSSADHWLERWSELTAEAWEEWTWRMRRYHENTFDPEAETAYNTYLQEILPRLTEVEQRLKSKLLALEGYAPPPERRMLVKRFANEAALFREENVPLESEAQLLGAEFEKLQAQGEVRIGSETLSVPLAEKRLLEPDRSVREAAWRGLQDLNLRNAPENDALFGRLLELRQKQARNAGFANYLEYGWRKMNRFDYTPEQARELHESIRLETVPLLAELREERKKTLGLERLRPWDVNPDPLGRESLAPFSSVLELEDGIEHIFRTLDPELGQDFADMRAQGNLELETRPGKVPGIAYNTHFAQSKQSYIFMNATGAAWDVGILLHECGHAFHALSSLRAGHLLWDVDAPIEFAEVASQAMEVLTLPLLERPVGFYSAEDTARARRDQLERVLRTLMGVTRDDALQHWLYTQDGLTPAGLDSRYLELSAAFEAGVDWTGLEREQRKGWQRPHLFVAPLYMLEYAIAWLGALQLWRSALENPKGALERYKFALTLGGTRALPELFEAAGIRFAFDRGTVRELMDFVRGQLEG